MFLNGKPFVEPPCGAHLPDHLQGQVVRREDYPPFCLDQPIFLLGHLNAHQRNRSYKEIFVQERIEGYRRIVLIPEIEQMMFVAGETGEPSSETTTLIEQIVHEQVFELVSVSFINLSLMLIIT